MEDLRVETAFSKGSLVRVTFVTKGRLRNGEKEQNLPMLSRMFLILAVAASTVTVSIRE